MAFEEFHYHNKSSRCLPLLLPLKEPEVDSVEVPPEVLVEEDEDEDDEEPRRMRTSLGESRASERSERGVRESGEDEGGKGHC